MTNRSLIEPVHDVLPEDLKEKKSYTNQHFGHEEMFPGIVYLQDRPDISKDEENRISMNSFSSNHIIAYCLGDYKTANMYEIITAW